VLLDLASLVLESGDPLFTRQLLEESLALFGELGDRRGIAQALEEFACLAASEAQPDRALRLAGAAQAIRDVIEVPPEARSARALEAQLARARDALGRAAADAAWREGRGMSVEQAIAHATGTLSTRSRP
jgi:hypothetical protein